MKKTFILAALVCVAAIFASCEKKEPTALELSSLPGKVTVKGYVTFVAQEKDSGTSIKDADEKAVENSEIVVLAGMDKDGDAIADAWTSYKATTDGNGFYEITLPCELGKQIDEVKVQCAFVGKTACLDADNNAHSDVTADYFGEGKLATPAAEGQIYELNVTATPKVLHGDFSYTI